MSLKISWHVDMAASSAASRLKAGDAALFAEPIGLKVSMSDLKVSELVLKVRYTDPGSEADALG